MSGIYKKKNGEPKKARKLGKWVNGYDGRCNKKYIAWRKKTKKQARRSRSINAKKCKG